jgi:hypothetical protein
MLFPDLLGAMILQPGKARNRRRGMSAINSFDRSAPVFCRISLMQSCNTEARAFAPATDWLNGLATFHAAPNAASPVAGRLWASFGCGCSAVAASFSYRSMNIRAPRLRHRSNCSGRPGWPPALPICRADRVRTFAAHPIPPRCRHRSAAAAPRPANWCSRHPSRSSPCATSGSRCHRHP